MEYYFRPVDLWFGIPLEYEEEEELVDA